MFFKAVWLQLYDKVKIMVIGAALALSLAIIDLLTGFDWTTATGGPLGTFIGLTVIALGAYAKKEISGHIVENVNQVDTGFDPNSAPPVG